MSEWIDKASRARKLKALACGNVRKAGSTSDMYPSPAPGQCPEAALRAGLGHDPRDQIYACMLLHVTGRIR